MLNKPVVVKVGLLGERLLWLLRVHAHVVGPVGHLWVGVSIVALGGQWW